MRTDPRKACANEKELLLWAILHDAIAHPLMVVTGYGTASLRFHDFTSRHAWPRDTRVPVEPVMVHSDRFGALRIVAQSSGIFEVTHGRISHRYCVQAIDVSDAVEQAEAWFGSLAELIPHSEGDDAK